MIPAADTPIHPGDRVFHPKYGFGTVLSLTRRDRSEPIHEPSVADAESNRTEDYYDIHLTEGGSLLVPVDRAASNGLRRLTVGVETIKCCFNSPAQSLPGGFRERAAALRAREQAGDPTALANCVRDMLVHHRGHTLSEGERTWLDRSYQRLCMEAALVDSITVAEARAAVWEAVSRLGATW